MADDTTLAHCFVLVNKRTALRGMTLETSFVSAQERKAAALERLLHIGSAAFNRDALVRVVTIGAAHFPFQHRMMVRQLELRPHFQVTLETGFRDLPRIDDRVRRAAALDVQTARSVTRFAAHVLRVLSVRLQSRVRRGAEIARDLFVAGLRTLPSRQIPRRECSAAQELSLFSGAAGKQNYGQRDSAPDHPPKFFALTVDPSS